MALFPRAEQTRVSYLRQRTMEEVHAQPSEVSTPQTISEPSTICWPTQHSTFDQMSQYAHTTAYRNPAYGFPFVLPPPVFDNINPYPQLGYISQTPLFENFYHQYYYNQSHVENTVGYPQPTPAVDHGPEGGSMQQYRTSAAQENTFEYWSPTSPEVNTNFLASPVAPNNECLRNTQPNDQLAVFTINNVKPSNTDAGHGRKPGKFHLFLSESERLKLDLARRADIARCKRREKMHWVSDWAAQVESTVAQDSSSESSTVTSSSRVPKRRMSINELDSSSVAPTVGSEEHQSVKRARTSKEHSGPRLSRIQKERRNTNACASCRASHKKCDGNAVACEYKTNVGGPYVWVPSVTQPVEV